MIDAAIPPLHRWLLYTGVLWVTGGVAWKLWILPALSEAEIHPPGTTRALERRVAGAGAWMALALIPVWGMGLWAQVIGFRDPFVPVSEDIGFLLLETLWGDVWMGQGVLLLVLAGGFFMARRASGREAVAVGWMLASGAVAGLALTLALTSHAMSVMYNRPLAVAMDASHTLAAGAWMGTLAVILTHRGREDVTLFSPQLRAFSPLAIAAVAVLLFMGVVLSAVHLGEVRNLWASEYGRMLSLKVSTVGVVLVLGFLNWRKGLPHLDTPSGRKAVRVRATWEVGAALLVLLFTALLLGTSMPEGVHE